MNLTRFFTVFTQLFLSCGVITGLYFFCESKTCGFRPYLILSNLPNDPRWDMPELTPEEQKNVETLLNQRFRFLGSGGWCFAFLGEDRKTVLKFYRHTHLGPLEIAKNFSFQKLLLKSPTLPRDSSYFQEFTFNSCALMYREMKERTGLLYVHLNKTEGKHKPVTLIDNIGVQHVIDLDKTEFVLQKRADLLIPHIHALASQNKMSEAKACLEDILLCLRQIYQKGIKDHDTSLRNNFGFTDQGAIALDLSSFGQDLTLQNLDTYQSVIRIKTKRLSHYLKKYQPELYAHFEQKLCEL